MSVATTSTTATAANLEQNVFSGVPSLVSQAMGPARQWFSGALEWVCGEPDTLRATGQQYAELGTKVQQLAQQLGSDQSLVPTWAGPGHDAFVKTTTKSVDVLNAAGQYTAATQEILNAAAQVAVEAANMIWDLVTELVQWLVMTLIKALAASTVSMGSSIAAWLGSAIGQVAKVVAKVAQICGKVGQLLTKIVQLLTKITALIAKYRKLLTEIEQILRKVKELADKSKGLQDALGNVPDGVTWAQFRDATPEQRATMMAPDAVGAATSAPGVTGAYDPNSLAAPPSANLPNADFPNTTADLGVPDASTTGVDAPTSGAVAAGVGTGPSSTGTMPTTPPPSTYAPGGGSISTPTFPSGATPTGYQPTGGSTGAGVRSVSQLPPLTSPSTGLTASVPTSTIGSESAGGAAMAPMATPLGTARMSGSGVASESRDEWNESNAEAAAARAMDGFGSGTVAAGVGDSAGGLGGAAGIGAPVGTGVPVIDAPARTSAVVGGTAGGWTATGPTAPVARPSAAAGSGGGIGAPLAMPLGTAGRTSREPNGGGPTLTETGWELEQSPEETEEVATGVIGA